MHQKTETAREVCGRSQEHVSWQTVPEDNSNPHILQVARVKKLFPVSIDRARLIADLAFQSGRQR